MSAGLNNMLNDGIQKQTSGRPTVGSWSPKGKNKENPEEGEFDYFVAEILEIRYLAELQLVSQQGK